MLHAGKRTGCKRTRVSQRSGPARAADQHVAAVARTSACRSPRTHKAHRAVCRLTPPRAERTIPLQAVGGTSTHRAASGAPARWAAAGRAATSWRPPRMARADKPHPHTPTTGTARTHRPHTHPLDWRQRWHCCATGKKRRRPPPQGRGTPPRVAPKPSLPCATHTPTRGPTAFPAPKSTRQQQDACSHDASTRARHEQHRKTQRWCTAGGGEKSARIPHPHAPLGNLPAADSRFFPANPSSRLTLAFGRAWRASCAPQSQPVVLPFSQMTRR